MYNKVKKIFPKDFLIKNELLFRKLVYIFYWGKSHQCMICDQQFRRFLLNQRGEKLCPSCGSMPRDRRLFALFKKELPEKEQISLLDFSPSRSLYRKLKKTKNIEYFPTDLSTDFISEYQYDITKIPLGDEVFDCIFCYHILEHIDADSVAMKELHRVLKKGGKAFVQTPFKEGEIYENAEMKTVAQRLEHFGQQDHVRIYSIVGLQKRLEAAGFDVVVKIFEKDERYGLSENETILYLRKN